jgi:hypothetical protein
VPRKEVAPINLFDLFAKISLDTSEYDSGVKDVSKSGGSLASKLKSGLASAGKVAAKGIAAIGTAASGAVVGLLALESSTEEYRVAMGKLNTAFEAAGYGAETAQQAYNAFYGILGDTDTATEASQLLAKLADSAEDVSTWTDIAAGVAGTFGDSLPIEGLIEASNETAKVGQVTGVLADALNWAGISEDDFNARLSACSSESERNQLIMDTLSGTYDEASEAFYRNNEALVESRNNQAQLDATLATLGQTVSNVKNRLLSEFLPAISNVATAFSGMLSGTAGADQQFSTAVQGLVNVAVSKLPEFLNMGVQILSSLASGIVQSIPTLVAAVPQIVAEIGAALTELLPQVLDMGVQLLDQFTSGIETGLPDMVSRIPEIITQFLSYITEQLPTILDKGVELLNNLVNGIIRAIPQMVAALPQIITSFAKFIADNLPEIVRAGIDILMNLITGIIKTIPDLVASLPQIINAIIDGIGNLMGGIVDIGKNIVEGIWQGIQDMAVWIKDKVTGFFSGIVDGVKNFLGIRSPSKLFRDEIGRNIGLGVAEGIEDSEDDAVKAANDLAKSVYDKSVDWLDKQTKYQNFSLQQQLEVWEAIQGQFIKESQQYADAEEKIFDLRKQIQEEYYDKVQEITTNISDLEQNYQNELSKRTQEIFNSFGLFDQIPERQKVAGDELLENLSGQIAAMEDFYSGLDELMSRGVGSALVDEIRSMGPDAADELSALLSLSDEKLSEYASLYQEKQELANSIAVNELEELRKETDTQIQKNLQSLEELYNKNAPTVGKAFTDGLSSGIMSGLSSVVNSAVNVAQAAVKATRDALGIHSPSRVFADIGKNMALGLGQGWDNEYDRIRRDIEGGMDFGTASVDFASSGLGVASAGMVNGVSASVQGAGMSGGSITVNLMMPDGTKFASYLLGPLSNYAKANGTPILHPT